MLNSLEICAGAGGQALGLEMAGFGHAALVELDEHACKTLVHNRPEWNVLNRDLRDFVDSDLSAYKGIDLLAGGVPCPPFSKAGKQLGELDERNLFDIAHDLVERVRPKAVMFENVRGLLDPMFKDYREKICARLRDIGYEADWKLLHASDFGVSQLRPRVVLVAMERRYWSTFSWPTQAENRPLTVGEKLKDLMAANGWEGAEAWANVASKVAPTLVGGSKKHGGPDLGPTRARKAWAELGVDGIGIANEAPSSEFVGVPKITVEMGARLQGFPSDWEIIGKKTHAWRQVGNAFPPPVAYAVASRIAIALKPASLAKARRRSKAVVQEQLPEMAA